jgi:transposase
MSRGSQYTLEFKKEAVKLVLEQGYAIKEAAERLGINPKNLSRWKQEYLKAGTPKLATKTLTPEQEELMKLKKEIAQLKLEREILKKAAAFFAKESS